MAGRRWAAQQWACIQRDVCVLSDGERLVATEQQKYLRDIVDKIRVAAKEDDNVSMANL